MLMHIRYLGYSDYLLQQGLEGLCSRVQEAARKVLADWPLQRPVSFDEAMHIFLQIRTHLDANPSALLASLLPPEDSGDHHQEVCSIFLVTYS